MPSVHRPSTFVKSVHGMHRQPNVLEVYCSLPPGDSTNSQDGDEDSESDGSDASCSSPSKYNSADFQSSLRGFEMSESKRKRLRELEASAFFLMFRYAKSNVVVLLYYLLRFIPSTVISEVTLHIHLNILFKKHTLFNLVWKTLLNVVITVNYKCCYNCTVILIYHQLTAVSV